MSPASQCYEIAIQLIVAIIRFDNAIELRPSFAAVLAPGPHTLSLSLEDYEAKTVRVNIEEGGGNGRVRKNVVLDSLFGEKIAFRGAKGPFVNDFRKLLTPFLHKLSAFGTDSRLLHFNASYLSARILI